MIVDQPHDLAGQLVRLQQAAKAQDRALGHRLVEQIQARKSAHARHIVKRVFGTRIGEIEPLLHEIDPQHHLQRPGTATAASLGIVRLD